LRQRKARPKTPHRATPAQRVKPAAKPKSKHTGRPTDYDPAKLPDVVKALEAGQTQAMIAGRIFGVRPEQLSRWKQIHPQLTQAIQQGEQRYWEAAIDNVERVSVAAATGRIPKTVSEIRDKDGKLTGERVIEYQPSSAVDRFFLMCNKRPDQWKNVQRVEIGGERGGPVPLVFAVVGVPNRRVTLDPRGAIVQESPDGNGYDRPKALEADKSETSETED